jgi:hypothetical protein
VSELHKAGLIAATGAIRLGRAGKAQRVFCFVTQGDGTLFGGMA